MVAPRIAVLSLALLATLAGAQPTTRIVALPTFNAYDAYVEAAGMIAAPETVNQAVAKGEPFEPAGLAAKEAALKPNEAALAKFREGLPYPCAIPPVRSFDQPMPALQQVRNLARLLRLEGQVRGTQGDWKGALASDLDAVRLGTDLMQGGPLIAALVGDSCENEVRGDLWTILGHLFPDELDPATRRLSGLLVRRPRFGDAVRGDREPMLAGIGMLFKAPAGQDWRKAALTMLPGELGQGVAEWLAKKETPEAVLADVRAYLDTLIEQLGRPYDPQWQPPAGPLPIFAMMAQPYRAGQVIHLGSEAQEATLTVAFALEAYATAKGRYPEKLEALCPEFLEQLPPDPFARQRPLRYQRQDKSYLLYSVGPDGVDDGGKRDEVAPGAALTAETKGDLVMPAPEG